MTRVHYPEDVASVAKARDHVASALSDIAEEVRERAILITSELATNAIAHAHSAFTLTLTRTHDEIHISVSDTGGRQPIMRHPQPHELRGRGLLITDSFADRWGVQTQSAGTTVWFALCLTPRGSLRGARRSDYISS